MKRCRLLVAHVTLPAEWRVVLFSPHGPRRGTATANGPRSRPPDREPDALRRIAETAIVPAARNDDINAFGEAVYEFNRKAGEPFAAAQGGVYASTEIAELIADVRETGIRGVGQSSWGPTVFAIVPDADTALSLVLRFRSRVPTFVSRSPPGTQFSATRASEPVSPRTAKARPRG